MATKSGLSAEALAERLNWIGASEVPALFGFGSLWELYRAKRPDLFTIEEVEGEEEEEEEAAEVDPSNLEAEALERGNVLEDPIAQWAARREAAGAYKVTRAISLIGSGVPLGATPDYVIVPPAGGRPRFLEIKTSINSTAGGGWGEEGTDAVPFRVLLQVMTQLGCARHAAAGSIVSTAVEHFEIGEIDLESAIVVRLDGRLHLSRYVIRYSAPLFSEILERANRFWREHVIAGVAPPPGSSEKAREWLRQAFPEAAKTYANAGAEDEATVARWIELKAAIAPLVKEKTAIENGMRERIGSESGLIVRGLGGVVNLGNDKPRSSWRRAAELIAERAAALIPEGWDAAEVVREEVEASRPEFGPRVLRWSKNLKNLK
jgi:predicted phage-related endonuclease